MLSGKQKRYLRGLASCDKTIFQIGKDALSDNLIEQVDHAIEARELVKSILDDFQEKNVTDWSTLKSGMRDGLREFLYEKTKRKPMILPIIMEV